MKLKWIFQFLSLKIEAETLCRLLSKIDNSVSVILDLEDTVQIPFDTEKTTLLKEKARNTLIQFSKVYFKPELKQKISLRINKITNEECEKDIYLLNEIKNDMVWDCIFLPKIESAAQFNYLADKLKDINCNEFIFMLESEKCKNNFNEITRQLNRSKLSRVMLGHSDYFLDNHTFPMPLQNSVEFWDVAKEIIDLCESNELNYIHTVFTELRNEELFLKIINKINSITNKEFGVTTLSSQQTSAALNIDETIVFNDLTINNFKIEDRLLLAEKVVSHYNSQLNRKAGFTIIDNGTFFITPHDYISAVNFLEKHKR
jgi:citrate lyase beta subunit